MDDDHDLLRRFAGDPVIASADHHRRCRGVLFGYFGAHDGQWLDQSPGRRARALAAAIYLFSYYLGGSVIGSASGLAWDVGGWSAVVAVLGLCAAVALAIAVRLRSVTLPATNPALAADPATC